MFSHHHVWDFIPLAKTLIFESIPEILLQRLHGAHPNNLPWYVYDVGMLNVGDNKCEIKQYLLRQDSD